ncbi:MAG TPA: protein kinase, partial [Bacillota bacterium]|nr:protein kinase [Bacillota bacterium]
MSSKVIAGRYELLEKIGDGGMAVVYKAKCRLLNRFVAVKILKPEFVKDAKFVENFRKESHAAASLSHPNIVNVYDVGREGSINYIVMELVEGKTLSSVIKEEAPLPYKRVIELTKQIASGLSAAHKNNIIHRDVKPHNILITEDGVAKITDFGIAKAVTSTTIVGNTSEAIMGSVHYFSPEQARGGYVDEKSDIYSLGIV